jgi:hypothetical protein
MAIVSRRFAPRDDLRRIAAPPDDALAAARILLRAVKIAFR